MIKEKGSISMGTAALISALPLFFPTAIFAEFYVFEKLIVYDDAAKTAQNLLENPKLFLSGIYAMLFTFIMDVVLAWTMYIFVKPVNESLALLGAWLRVVYAGLAIVALFNFIYAYQLVNLPHFRETFKNEHVLLLVNARQFAMNIAFIVFGVYMILGGILMYKASYIPKVMGIMIMLAGATYIIISLKPYFFKEYDLSWMMVFYVGELAFGIWLLVRGSRIKESEIVV